MVSHDTPFVATIVVSLALAYAGGILARIAGLPNIVGYILAGIFVGPHTPGFTADQKLTAELAEIGVALLMFAIGLHFSPRDLLRVWHIAVPGALLQVAACTLVGFGAGQLLGWPVPASLVLGLAGAISSTAVAIKALEDRGQLSTDAGRIALGWLVVQDLVVIIALVLLPLVAAGVPDVESLALMIGKTLLMIALFAGFLLGVGQWLLPAILRATARLGSRELFTLGVIVLALGFAYGSSMLTGMSLALGAFFAGLVLGESDLSYQAAAESLPIQSIFTVLFFVSVGMLFDPTLFVTTPLGITTLVIAIIGGSMIFLLIMLALGVSPAVAASASGTLAQVGEFSFILTGVALGLGIMSPDQQGLLLAAALVSILLHSLTMRIYAKLGAYLDARLSTLPQKQKRQPAKLPDGGTLEALSGHVIVVGHGRVGSVIASALRQAGESFIVLEGQWRVSEQARAAGDIVIFGDATRPDVLGAARPRQARLIAVALPDAFQSRRVIELAREANPSICIVARAHSDDEYQYLMSLGADLVIMGEREIALSMSDFTLQRMGLDAARAQAIVDELRDGAAIIRDDSAG
jgi:CPA2 family monovalent cation:H+ antiporter-2